MFQESNVAARLKRLWRGWPGRVLRVVFAVLPTIWIVRNLELDDVWSSALSVGLPSMLGEIVAAYT